MSSTHLQAQALLQRDLDDVSLSSLDEARQLLADDRAELLAIQADIAAQIPAPTQPLTRETARIAFDAKQDLHFLVHGFDGMVGITNPRLAERRGLPGLAELDRLLARLDRLREKVVERDEKRRTEVWPRKFAYTGRSGDAEWHGRNLQPGDVVELTEAQAKSWRDRFTPVGI